MSRFLPPLCLLLLLVAAPAVQADVIDDRAEYGRCMDMARHDPDQGWEEAQHWLGLGGGEAARHCAAIALIGRGKVAEGAQMLEELAGKSHRAAPLRAQMLAQAAESWVMIKDYVHAYNDQNAALKLAPDDPDLLLDRSITLAETGRYNEAVTDLDKVLAAQPGRALALALRATAWRFLDRRDDAERDVAAALAADPELPEAWLEQGILKRLRGDDKGARLAWRKVIDLNSDSPAADQARRNIEILEIKK